MSFFSQLSGGLVTGLAAVFGGAKDSSEKVPEPAASRADEHMLQDANEDRPENVDAGVDQMLEEPVALGAKRKREEDNSGAVPPGTVELLVETRLDPEAEEEVQEAREPSSSAASQSNGEHDQQQVESAATGSSAATAPCSRARVRPLSHCRVRPLSQHRA